MSDFQPKPFGKYFLIEKLATGGMAEIYKAKTFGVDGFEKLLAIKRILPHCSTDKEFITMLIDEAKLSVVLSHTNIVQVFDLGKVGSDYFISMEYVEGINLREFINRCKERGEKIPEDIAVYIISEVCKGLDYAHAKKDMDGNPLNIVHRDISPQNILISFEGEVKVVDFGIAKAAMNMSHTMAGVLKGKITYMSPEQALGKPVDCRTDIFSTGLILNELLTQQRFFTGDSQFEVLKKIRSTRISETTLAEDIPLNLRKTMATSLAYSPKDRFQNAGDMQIELTKYLYSTYIDFSPRKLSQLVKRLFDDEIKSKQTKYRDEMSIDAKTRSILLESEAQQFLVHREDAEKTTVEKGMLGTHSVADLGLAKTDPGIVPLPGQGSGASASLPNPSTNPFKWIFLTLLFLFLAGGGYYAYKNWNPPPPKIGTLIINSNPPGAQVTLNDKETDYVTPATIPNVELFISQKVTLKKAKFLPWERLVTVISDQPLSLDAKLESVPVGSIHLISDPPGAKAWLDGKEIGVTPLKIPDLELKSYTLRLEKEDHKPLEQKVEVTKADTSQDLNLTLTAIKYGNIEVTSDPSEAQIFINDLDTGLKTPNHLPKFEVGTQITLQLKKERFVYAPKTITIEENPIVLKEKLAKEPAFLSVSSDPSGADVSINGQRRGQTPGRFEITAEQSVRVTISKTRYESATQQISALKSGDTKSTSASLKQVTVQYANLSVTTDPPGAAISIDGEGKSGGGPFQVVAGKGVRVSVSKEGFETATQSVSLKPDETRSIALKLKLKTSSDHLPDKPPPMGDSYVSVSSKPAGADVFINGVNKGATPGKFKVSPGNVEVMVRSASGSKTQEVSVKEGETKVVSFNFDQVGGGVGMIVIFSEPPGAAVFFDGAATGRSTPLKIPNLRMGTDHTIRLELNGKTWSRSFSVDREKMEFMANLK